MGNKTGLIHAHKVEKCGNYSPGTDQAWCRQVWDASAKASIRVLGRGRVQTSQKMAMAACYAMGVGGVTPSCWGRLSSYLHHSRRISEVTVSLKSL